MIIRYSMIDSFLTCPKCFYKRYILGIEDKTKSSAAEYGQAIHCAIRAHFEGGDMYWNSVKNLDMIWYRYGWQELADLANQKFIPNFLKLHAKNFTDYKLEETIEMPLLDTEEKNTGGTLFSIAKRITLQGTFDYCGLYKGALTLVDWKTSTNDYKPTRIKRNHQLYVYSALYKHKYGVLPTGVMYKTFVKSKGSIQTSYNSIDEKTLELHLTNIRSIVISMLQMIESKSVYSNYNCFNGECLNE